MKLTDIGLSLDGGKIFVPPRLQGTKKNIKKIDISPSGLNIYSFEYIKGAEHGYGTYQGVMSNEIPLEAVVANDDGFDRVDYSKLDVEFKKIKNEL